MANVGCKLYFNRNTESSMEVTGEHLISVVLSEMFDSSEGIAIGSASSNSLMVNMIVPPGLAFATATIEAAAITGEREIALGKFYVCSHTTENNYKTVTLECYDPFCKTEELYVPTVDAPASISDVTADICDQCGFEADFDFSGYEDIQIPWFGEYTCRQMIGYIAGLMGMNAHFNRNGKLTFSWYEDSPITIKREEQYINQLKMLRAEPFTIDGLISGTADEEIHAGVGAGISFENPYMTQEILEGILVKTEDFSYQPCSVMYRGNLDILPGTRINIENDTGENIKACVMEHVISLTGGMSGELFSYGKEDVAYSFESASVSKTLGSLSRHMERAVMMTKTINESEGGVFQVIDADGDGINDSFIIRMAGEGGNFIRGNADGIGFSKDGGQTYTTAINQDGICTEAIDTNKLFAQEIGVEGVTFSDAFKVRQSEDEGMVMILGSGINNVIMQQENDQIAFYEKEKYEEGHRQPLCSFGVQSATGKKLIKLGNLSIESWLDGKITFSTAGGEE